MAIKVRLNRAGVRKLLRSPELMRVLETEARKRVTHPDVKQESFTGRNRDRVTLSSFTPAGKDALRKAFGK